MVGWAGMQGDARWLHLTAPQPGNSQVLDGIKVVDEDPSHPGTRSWTCRVWFAAGLRCPALGNEELPFPSLSCTRSTAWHCSLLRGWTGWSLCVPQDIPWSYNYLLFYQITAILLFLTLLPFHPELNQALRLLSLVSVAGGFKPAFPFTFKSRQTHASILVFHFDCTETTLNQIHLVQVEPGFPPQGGPVSCWV